jgi:hypothetical protein
MKIFKFDAGRAAEPGRLFDDGIEEDPWVMYHGTSAFNGPTIERDGFRSPAESMPRGAVEQVTRIFEQMRWKSSRGYMVLRDYSLGHNIPMSGCGRIFFAETSLRGLLYARREFAGGETCFALRKAFVDLQSYLDDSSVRESHDAYLAMRYKSLRRNNAHQSELDKVMPASVELDWLRAQLDAVEPIRTLATDAFHRHNGGTVYAVKVQPEDVARFSWHREMGISTDRPVSADRILARVDTPSDANMLTTAYQRSEPPLPRTQGLLGALLTKPVEPAQVR